MRITMLNSATSLQTPVRCAGFSSAKRNEMGRYPT